MPKRLLPGLALGVAVLFGTGCATLSNRAVCPSEGGPKWHEVQSAHFRVRTNLDPEDARKVTQDLEKFRRALLMIWTRNVDPPGRVEAIVLRNRGQLEEFAGRNFAGYFTYTDNGPIIVMDGAGSLFAGKATDGSVQAHELAHYLSRFFLLRQPRWFAEGLAAFLQTVELSEGGTQAVFGKPLPLYLGYVQVRPWVTLEELWRWDARVDTSNELLEHYASSWLWFHYLLNEHGPRFTDFQMRLARAEEPRKAFEAAFAGAGDLEAGVQRYVAGGNFGIWRFPLEEVAPEMRERELEGAEVHAIRARLFLTGKGAWEERKKAALLEVAQALRENPTQVSAVQRQAAFTENHEERLALAEALVKAHPDSGPAWGVLARAHSAVGSPVAVQEQALVRAVELSPDDASARNSLAWLYVQTNVPQKGYELALSAVKQAPYSPAFVDTYAAVLFAMGQCPKSISTQRRAMELLHEKAPAEERQDYQSRLTKYETACREREAAGASTPEQRKPAR